MLMNEIEIRSEKLAKKCAEELNLEILEVSFVKENGSRILRIIADSKGGLTIDEATALNEKISDALDREDFIDEEYFLEVSSAGLERELKKISEENQFAQKRIVLTAILHLKQICNHPSQFTGDEDFSILDSGKFVACERVLFSDDAPFTVNTIGYYEQYIGGKYLDIYNSVCILNEQQCEMADEYTGTTFFTDFIKEHGCNGMFIQIT